MYVLCTHHAQVHTQGTMGSTVDIPDRQEMSPQIPVLALHPGCPGCPAAGIVHLYMGQYGVQGHHGHLHYPQQSMLTGVMCMR